MELLQVIARTRAVARKPTRREALASGTVASIDRRRGLRLSFRKGELWDKIKILGTVHGGDGHSFTSNCLGPSANCNTS
jgi:hypothetical protein